MAIIYQLGLGRQILFTIVWIIDIEWPKWAAKGWPKTLITGPDTPAGMRSLEQCCHEPFKLFNYLNSFCHFSKTTSFWYSVFDTFSNLEYIRGLVFGQSLLLMTTLAWRMELHMRLWPSTWCSFMLGLEWVTPAPPNIISLKSLDCNKLSFYLMSDLWVTWHPLMEAEGTCNPIHQLIQWRWCPLSLFQDLTLPFQLYWSQKVIFFLSCHIHEITQPWHYLEMYCLIIDIKIKFF